MSNLDKIATRHGQDRWKDAGFIVAALLLVALSIGAMTSQGAGRGFDRIWTVTIVDGHLEPGR